MKKSTLATSETGAKQQEYRRVVEEPVLDAGFGCTLFGSLMCRLVIGEFRRAGIGETARGIEADKIGAGRLS